MKIKKITLFHWGLAAIFIGLIGFCLAALFFFLRNQHQKVLNDDAAEKQASVQAVVVSEAMSHQTKKTAANMEALLDEMTNMKIRDKVEK